MENLLRKEEAQKIAKELNDNYGLQKAMSLIKDNKIEFTSKKDKYRIRLLNQQDKDDLDLLRRKKYSELLQAKDDKGNPSFLFIKELVKLYKERNVINIEELDSQIDKLWKKINELRIKQGEALENKDPESILKNYDTQIQDCLDEISGIVYQKTIYLENSFEKTLEHYVVKVSSWLSLEKEVDNKFIKAFDNIEDFLRTEEELITLAVSFSLALNYNL